MTQNKDTSVFYLEKTFSQSSSDVAHLLKYLYYHKIRYDGKHWYYFTNHRWIITDEDQCPLVGLMRNDLVNRYLSLATEYNFQVQQKNNQVTQYQDENPAEMPEYLPLIITDLIYKSKLCSEMSLKLTSDSYYQKVVASAQGLFTQKNFLQTVDQNPHLLGFNNGVYDLKTGRLEPARHDHKVLMSVGYEYKDETDHHKEVIALFEKMNLMDFLPILASLLWGNRRQPIVWVSNLTENSMYALSQLIHWTMGDYQGNLSFSLLRKRKIPSGQNHTHSELIDNCKRRIVIVEQHPEDFPNVFPPMVETLLCARKLSLRRPHQTSYEYTPQFGMVILSRKSDTEPLKGSMQFIAKDINEVVVKEAWRQDFIKILLNYLTP